MQLNKLRNYLKKALVAAENSHDDERQVGAIFVNKLTEIPVSEGYNAFIRKAHDHILPRAGSEKYEYIQHAEQKLLTNCLRNHIDIRDCVTIVTLSPCQDCVRLLWESGIGTIYFPSDKIHETFKHTLAMKDINIKLETLEEFTRLTLSGKVEKE